MTKRSHTKGSVATTMGIIVSRMSQAERDAWKGKTRKEALEFFIPKFPEGTKITAAKAEEAFTTNGITLYVRKRDIVDVPNPQDVPTTDAHGHRLAITAIRQLAKKVDMSGHNLYRETMAEYGVYVKKLQAIERAANATVDAPELVNDVTESPVIAPILPIPNIVGQMAIPFEDITESSEDSEQGPS